MESNEKRQCTCSKCNGKLVSKATFYKHSKKCHNTLIKSRKIEEVLEKPQYTEYSFPEKIREKEQFQLPLHQGTSRTLLDAISHHMLIFATNNGFSKAALTQCLQLEKRSLPQPNILPSTYKEAVNIIQPLLIPIQRYKCCINDCQIFPIDADVYQCNICHENLSYNNSNRCRKTFHYMPVLPRIARWFGTKNLAKILHANKLCTNGKLSNYKDGNIFKKHLTSGVFKDQNEENCVPLALFTDGVNPNKNSSAQKSMWPIILTWITLPQEIRYLLGPMMLVGIVPGYGRKEPKILDPYVRILVEELLCNMECKLYDSYKNSPVDVKIALLQYLCDIPAFSKLLHCSGQAALRSCLYCKEVGVRCNTLSKVIHLSNRQFLPKDSPLRQDCQSFAIKQVEMESQPDAYSRDEEMKIRKAFDEKKNNNQKSILQKETGFKGMHPFHSLPYFDRATQMQTDGMHTISDVIGNILDLISGKSDGAKVRNCERQHNRFENTWIQAGSKRNADSDVIERPPKKQKKSQPNDHLHGIPTNNTSSDKLESTVLPEAPWLLNKQKLNIADCRAKSVKYPRGFDYTPADHFSRQWTLRTMHGKQQFVTQKAAAWCLRGLLGGQQEETLFFLFNVIRRLVQPTYTQGEITQLITDTHLAVTLLERDFPLSLQNLTTHLLHHIPEGFMDFGPLYDRWLYPLERANSWITRQILQHGHEESTVMQTYCIYDWSAFNLLSGAVNSDFNKTTSLYKIADKIQDKLQANQTAPEMNAKVCKKQVMLTSHELNIINKKYCKVLSQPIEMYEIDPMVQSVNTTYRIDATTKKTIFFSTVKHQMSSSRSCDSMVCLNQESTIVFGKINKIYKHVHLGNVFTWAVLDIFPDPITSGDFWYTEDRTVSSQLCYFDDLSNPLVTASEDEKCWFLNV